MHEHWCDYKPTTLLRTLAVIGVLFLLLSALLTGASAQSDMTGTIGEPCDINGRCAYTNACNEAGLCERCGGPGQIICPEEPFCQEAYAGWRPTATASGFWYCGKPERDSFNYRNNCGSVGFPACPGRDYCWGASVVLGAPPFCVACGLLGQRCCADSACREPGIVCSAENRCRRPVNTQNQSGNRGNNGDSSSSGGLFGDSDLLDDNGIFEGQTIDDYLDRQPSQNSTTQSENTYIDPVTGERIQLQACVCRSSDGRHSICEQNGCGIPPNFSGSCYWSCTDVDGKSLNIRGSDGQIMR